MSNDSTAPHLQDEAFTERAKALKWLLLDVDGVLTDGSLYYTADGETLKRFHVRDGLGLKLAQRSGLRVGLFTGRGGPTVERRATDLGLDHLIQKSHAKGSDFDDFLARFEVAAEHVAYIGDDLQDLEVLERCGLSFAPADGHDLVRASVNRVLTARGGHGAGREMVELILQARGLWPSIIASFSNRSASSTPSSNRTVD